MRIALEARLVDGRAGGIQQVVAGLALGLSQLEDADDEYVFIVESPGGEWLSRYIGGRCRVHAVPARRPPVVREFVKRTLPKGVLSRLRTLRGAYAGRTVAKLSASDGIAEELGCQLVHFPYQSAYVTNLPTIYHPHDLQHLHLPSFFTPDEIQAREFLYRGYCERASLVAVTSTWIKNDVVQQYRIAPDKIAVIPLAPINEGATQPSTAEITAVRERLGLNSAFAFYPAQTWRHKNHISLLRGLALLVKSGRGRDINFVFSGLQTDFAPQILQAAEELSLTDRVRFLGYLSSVDIRCLFRAARCVVVPSLFEAASFPVWEAFVAGTPVACSNVTSLPAQAGDAALIFDPRDEGQIANALEQLWTDESLRLALTERGRIRVGQFSWHRTAATFRAHYRRLLGVPMSSEDLQLLQAPPQL